MKTRAWHPRFSSRVRTITWDTFIYLDRWANYHSSWIPMPHGTTFGSGKWETLSKHWAMLTIQEIPWAKRTCHLLQYIECDHCLNKLKSYFEEAKNVKTDDD